MSRQSTRHLPPGGSIVRHLRWLCSARAQDRPFDLLSSPRIRKLKRGRELTQMTVDAISIWAPVRCAKGNALRSTALRPACTMHEFESQVAPGLEAQSATSWFAGILIRVAAPWISPRYDISARPLTRARSGPHRNGFTFRRRRSAAKLRNSNTSYERRSSTVARKGWC